MRAGGRDCILSRPVPTVAATDQRARSPAPIELRRTAASGRGHSPNPIVGAVVARDGEVLGRGLARALRRPARRGRRARRRRRRRPGRRDAVRLARAVLPPGQDAAVHRRDRRGRHRARRRRLRRPDREGHRPRPGHPARRGRRGRRRRRRARARARAAQPGVPQARAHRAPVGAVQVGDDARRQGRHADRRLEVDLRRAQPRAARTAGARRSTPSSSASAPRWPTTRS